MTAVDEVIGDGFGQIFVGRWPSSIGAIVSQPYAPKVANGVVRLFQVVSEGLTLNVSEKCGECLSRKLITRPLQVTIQVFNGVMHRIAETDA